jgi:hypothetical protein
MVMARRLNLQPHKSLQIADRTSHPSLAIHHLSKCRSGHSTTKLRALLSMGFSRLLVNADSDPELFWKNLDRNGYAAPSMPFEAALKTILPLDTVEYPTFTMIERLECLTKMIGPHDSPETLAYYLGIESCETAYPALEDSPKRELTRLAINHWGYSSAWNKGDRVWEQTLRALFTAGAKLGVLRSQETEDNPDVSRYGKPEDRDLVELIRHFVVPFSFHRALMHGGLVEARDTLKGFQHLVSRTDCIGIELGTSQPSGRFDICFDEVLMRSSYRIHRTDPFIDPHTLSLYYDDSLSTWVMWNSMYEEYCGEFWDLLEHPERTMPGTWVD